MLAIQSEGSLKKVRVCKKIIVIQITEGKERPYKTFFHRMQGKSKSTLKNAVLQENF